MAKGMYSENSYRYKYLSTNLMMNFNKQFGDFNFNLMLGTSTDDTRTWTNYRMAWNFEIPDFTHLTMQRMITVIFQVHVLKTPYWYIW